MQEWRIYVEPGTAFILTIMTNDQGNYELTPELMAHLLAKAGFERIA